MTVLPSQIVDLNSRTPFARKTFSEVGLKEKALDTLVVQHSTLIADLLIENDILDKDPGASRKVIGQVIESAAKFQDEVRASDPKERFSGAPRMA